MIILPAILESFRSLKDKSYKIVFESNELTPEQVVGLNAGLGAFGYLAFKKDPFKQSEKDMIDSLEVDFEDKKKSQGQRLRAVLYRLWEQRLKDLIHSLSSTIINPNSSLIILRISWIDL